jgi:hypothetical protein
MNTTWFEKGIEKGKRETVGELLEDAFGPLSAKVQERLQQLSLEELRQLSKSIRRAASLRELGLEE